MENNVPKIEWQYISVEQLRNGDFTLGDDKYGLAAYVLSPARVATILNCPFHSSEKNTALILCNVDGVVASREELFGTRLKLGENIVPCMSGTALETQENYRHLALAAEIMMFGHRNDEYDFLITAGLSAMAKPMHKKLKYAYFETPILLVYKDSRAKFSEIGLKGPALWLASKLYNLSLLGSKINQQRAAKLLRKKFQVKKESIVPEWVDNIVLNDGHKYMEVHDNKWLQWNLDYNFSDNPRNSQAFYCVYDKENQPVGFFMLKERCDKSKAGSIQSITGSLVEWGSRDLSELSEEDINVLALESYNSDVNIAMTTTDSPTIQQSLTKYGLKDKGSITNISCKANRKKTPDIYDIKNWRIRLGYADTIFS